MLGDPGGEEPQPRVVRDEHVGELPLLRLDPPLIGNIFTTHSEDRIVLGPDDVPAILLDGLKVVEDRDFDKHGGVSVRAIARAMWANVRAGEIEQGGSTLTQQLVRSYFLDNRRTLTRKLREALMSVLLELHFEKADILNAYVNEIYLGQAGERAIHGFGLASQFYFGRPLGELQAQDIALLIAVFPANLYAASHQLGTDNALLHNARLAFQLVFVAWAWWHTRPDGDA